MLPYVSLDTVTAYGTVEFGWIHASDSISSKRLRLEGRAARCRLAVTAAIQSPKINKYLVETQNIQRSEF